MSRIENPNPASVAMQKYARALLRRKGVKFITDGDSKMTVTAFLKQQDWDYVSELLDRLSGKVKPITTAPRTPPRPVEEV